MTDIKELARTLRQAAEEELMCREASDTSDLWQDEASPENVLALVEALEILQQENRVSELESDLAAEEERRGNWFRMAEELGGKLDAAEEHIRELDKRLIEYAGIATREAHRVAELEKYRTAFMEWHDKTAWVQSDKRFDVVRPLGKHRADVLREYIELLEARAAQTLTVRVPVRCDCCYSESEAAMFDGVVAEFREKLELACAIAGIKLQIEGE
ncbi:hypothetical protein KZ124_004033 [Salmonella enterica]|nr:hypothetical protein [Salmonella enterica subsp. enterica serovar Tudu]EHV2087275.1 hypothetical protein [Salmonella enterica]EHV2097785.1 hypothetical protein [Salmonella enterica]